MAKFTPYALAALPVTGIDVNGVYFIKAALDAKFKIYIRKSDNSAWVDLGFTSSVDSVNGLSGSVQLNLSLSGAGVLSITGGSSTINLDNRYDKKADSIAWSRISGTPSTLSGYSITDAALDVAVLHKTGAETKSGVLTLTDKPVIPAATASNEAVNKSQMDAAGAALQLQINGLNTQVTAGMKTPLPLDCSVNPNYPAATKGDTWLVTVEGKVGGVAGIQVREGAQITCFITNSGGTQTSVGSNFYILESDLDQATETVQGFAKIATQTLVDGGTNDTDFVTSKKLQKKVDDLATTNNGKFVRVDAAQSLSAGQKTQGRGNIGAAMDSEVIHTTSDETKGGVLTLTSSPVVPNAVNSNQAAAFGQISTIADAKYVRFDNAVQGLNATQKTNARTNIEAASLTDVNWGGAKEW